MSEAFDHFLDGNGRLARLIAAQPRFDAPEGMLERVLAAALPDDTALLIEPPASLEAAIMAEAARLDEAQAPRRAALLDQIANGTPPADALGASVSSPTGRWLAAQAGTRPPTRRPGPGTGRRRWFNGLGLAVAAALAASVALKVAFDPDAPTVHPEAADMAVLDAAPEPASVLPPPAPAPLAESMGAMVASPRPAPADRREMSPTARAAKAATPPPAAQAKPNLGNEDAAVARSGVPGKPENARGENAIAQPVAPSEADAALPEAEIRAAAPMKKALRERESPLERQAALADAAPVRWDLPLATPAQAIVSRMLSHPGQAWQWVVDTGDLARAKALRSAVMARLGPSERTDTIAIETTDRPTGSLRIEPAGD